MDPLAVNRPEPHCCSVGILFREWKYTVITVHFDVYTPVQKSSQRIAEGLAGI